MMALQKFARDEILKEFSVTSCIASTRIAIDVMGAYGIEAQPLPVSLMVFNKEAKKILEQSGSDEFKKIVDRQHPEAEGGPWSVGLGVTSHTEDNEWAGHLIVAVPQHGAYLDLSCDQASRPHKNIELTPHYFDLEMDDPWLTGKSPVLLLESNTGLLLSLDRRAPDPDGFRQSPNWTGEGQSAEPLRRVTRRVMALMDNYFSSFAPSEHNENNPSHPTS